MMMSRIFVTGSTDGLGKAVAQALMQQGHDMVLHARHHGRIEAVDALLSQGAEIVTGDLADLSQTKAIAEHINRTGPVDVIIHNAGIISGKALFQVNVVAPWLLSVLIARPSRMIFLSSSMHFDGRIPDTNERWEKYISTVDYSDSKLLLTTLSFALARIWEDVVINAVDPGWVATKMGGVNAPDDFTKGIETQQWLATATDACALSSGGYWHYQKQREPHKETRNIAFQEALLRYLEKITGVKIQ
ncbi:SDR family NAD(P)-dependent oxidoreductase [Scandinavium lactucae]|uniref:SDR family NAD(P)-dependent oxidoreductase n=2 Tax=Scandinavium lactucae TaxID=3095028 RepID=A0ABU4QSM5_9ENTR|nr:SDR family NAD(P)-dependent oxidoreductase [Scandinavium sp. V105_6]MDX6042266.1 SDR family NAD(P)-dependent oxidoreductase [Scandinavium sp. V105_6]MDX6052267.1 SDR family NAD(P)-dependent oxidoreductase [Scandinavium sp. V105_1]